MKQFIKRILSLLIISFINISNAQTNFSNVAYEVTNDVVKIEEYSYYATSIANVGYKQTDFAYSSVSTFKNGRILNQVNEGATYIVTGQSQRNYLYNDTTKEYSISGKTYSLISFGNLQFDYQKEGFKIISKSNTNLELQFDNGKKTVTYRLLKNGNVEKTTPDLWYEVKSTYNTIGQLIEKIRIDPKEPSLINLKTSYSHFDNGLPKSEEHLFQNEKDVYYYYFLDVEGNWVNKIIVTKTATNQSVTYTTRKLTYRDNSTTGSIQYNKNSILKLLELHTKTASTNKTGCISGNCQNGFGNYKDTEGFTYIGTFKNGMYNGACTWYDKNERLLYEGNVVEGKLQGLGTLYSENGDVFEGEFNNNKMDGYGRYTFANGDVYDGDFKNGFRNGSGMLTLANGGSFFGKYKDGLENGEGTIIHSNGDEESCNYINGKREGEAEYIFKSGKKLIYTYKNDKVISVKNVDAKSTIPNGIVWAKNTANTEYFLYKDGVAIEDYTFWVDNSLYVYLTKTSHKIYLLKDFKTKSADSYHNAELLSQTFNNGVWFKTAPGGLIIYDSSCKNISTNHDVYKYANNGVDVLFRESGKKDILLLKGFKNATVNKVNAADIYSLSNTTVTKATSFQAEVNACKNEVDPSSCIATKLYENYNKMKKSGVSKNALDKSTISNMNLVGHYDFEILWELLMNGDKFTSEDLKGILPNLDQDLKNKIKTSAQKVRDEYSKTHKMN
ncbi:MAG: hypothetical protein PSN34_03600 [Urechidicola sp.]|nr:hypothetical protein [Urechidicola sp.]